MRFGKLKVVSFKYYSKEGPPKYLLKCDCAVVCAVEIAKLTSGEVVSCGCDSLDVSKKVTTFTCRNLTMTIREWSDYVGINKNTLRSRIRRGWDLDRVFFTQVKISKKRMDQLAMVFMEAFAAA